MTKEVPQFLERFKRSISPLSKNCKVFQQPLPSQIHRNQIYDPPLETAQQMNESNQSIQKSQKKNSQTSSSQNSPKIKLHLPKKISNKTIINILKESHNIKSDVQIDFNSGLPHQEFSNKDSIIFENDLDNIAFGIGFEPAQEVAQYTINVQQIKSNELKEINMTINKPLDLQQNQNIQYTQKIYPKVYETYIPEPGKPPRNVAILRKQRLYESYKLKDLFYQSGLDLNYIFHEDQSQWLELHKFDDYNQDDYTNQEWIDKLHEQSEVRLILTGQTFHQFDSFYDWIKIKIIDYQEENQLFQVKPLNIQLKNQYIPRLYICFDAENPLKYTQRFLQAVKNRRLSDQLIRYNFIADMIPLNMKEEPNIDILNRIQKKVQLFKKYQKADLVPLIQEISYEYMRNQNKMLLNFYLENESLSECIFPRHLNLDFINSNFGYQSFKPRVQNEDRVEYQNFNQNIFQTETSIHDVTQLLIFNSAFVRKEVIQCITDFRYQSQKLLDQSLFLTNLTSRQNIDYFKSTQFINLNECFTYARNVWTKNLLATIFNNLGGIDKGYYCIHNQNYEMFEQGKLKKIFKLFKLLMEDTIYDLLKNQYWKFTRSIYERIPDQITIVSDHQVINTPVCEPLITIHLVRIPIANSKVEEGQSQQLIQTKVYAFQYLESIDKFIEDFENMFIIPIQQFSKIPELTPYVLDKLFSNNKDKIYIKSPILIPDLKFIEMKINNEINYGWLKDMYNEFKEKLQESVKPLNQYLEQFSKYSNIINTTPEEKVEEIIKQKNKIEKDFEYIETFSNRIVSIRNTIPEEIQVGFWQIDLINVKIYLIEFYQSVNILLKKHIEMQVKKQSMKLMDFYTPIEQKFNMNPQNIEGVTQMDDYIQMIPSELVKIVHEKENYLKLINYLEKKYFKFSKEENIRRWEIFGSQQRIQDKILLKQKKLKFETQVFRDKILNQKEDNIQNIEQIQETIKEFTMNIDIKQYEENAKLVTNIQERLKEYLQNSNLINQRLILLGEKEFEFQDLKDMALEFTYYYEFWTTCNNWKISKKKLLFEQLCYLDPLECKKEADQQSDIIDKVVKNFKKGYLKFLSELTLEYAIEIQNDIKGILPYIPLLQSLKMEGLMQRHWDQIYSLLNISPIDKDDVNLSYYLKQGLFEKKEEIVEISVRAYKEFQIQEILNSMQLRWEQIRFELDMHKDNISIIKGFDKLQEIMENDILSTQKLLSSIYKKQFEKEIIKWYTSLNQMSDVIEEWSKLQSKWIYLYPIFESPDMMQQMPSESRKFKGIDQFWRSLMNNILRNNYVLYICTAEQIFERLQEGNKSLDNIQNEMNNYLEKKRESFGRFYFLSNEDLIEILSLQRETQKIQPHLKKVFENIDSVQFVNKFQINAILSALGEKVTLLERIDTHQQEGSNMVEDWMRQMELVMRQTVQQNLIQALQQFSSPGRSLEEWIVANTSMSVLVASKIYWTYNVEQENLTKKTLLENFQLDLNELVQKIKYQTSQLKVITINSLIVLIVHSKDVVQNLIDLEEQTKQSFLWSMQLRYYMIPANQQMECFVQCAYSQHPFSYEYLGNTTRLVITPLTDKCFITLLNAMKYNFGGAPVGPAGTGKTETVKELSKSLATQCVVFNCSEAIDNVMISKFFKGLASTGSWCCFDEFNRIYVEVLSVIAQVLLFLLESKKNQNEVIDFEGSKIRVVSTFSVFITINPGQRGKFELPDNLKSLFRQISMIVPNYLMITEILLYSYGFQEARQLSKKIIDTFQNAQEQLSNQQHYDYSMRAYKSVINAAGNFIGRYQQEDEQVLILRALKQNTIPKLVTQDIEIFMNILKDQFHIDSLDDQRLDYFKNAIIKCCKKQNMQFQEIFVDKITQLFYTLKFRHGIMVLGNSGTGKSSVINILHESLLKINIKTIKYVINPKSVTIGQLFGQGEQNGEWTHGIFSNIAGIACRDTSETRHLIVMDGQVDTYWIENINSVLDDQKKLCLSNAQILNFTQFITMIFEVDNLNKASPAIISRCGMIVMDYSNLPYQCLCKSWIQKIPPSAALFQNSKLSEQINFLFDNILQDVLLFMNKNAKMIYPISENLQVESFLNILSSYTEAYINDDDHEVYNNFYIFQKNIEKLNRLVVVFEHLFIYCCSLAFGLNLHQESQKSFDNVLRSLILKHSFLQIFLPVDKFIHDHIFEIDEKRYISCKQIMGTLSHNIVKSPQYSNMIIHTEETILLENNLKRMIKARKNCLGKFFIYFLVIGQKTSGKSKLIESIIFKHLEHDKYDSLLLKFTEISTHNATQDLIEQNCEKRRKNVYGPALGKTFVLFIDDFNLPLKEETGAQPCLELIRQLIGYSGWYNRNDLNFLKIEDITTLVFINTHRNISSRIIRLFSHFYLNEINLEKVQMIFNSICSLYLNGFQDSIKEQLPKIIESSCLLLIQLQQQFLPTPSKIFYQFSFHDVWRLFLRLQTCSTRVITSISYFHQFYYNELTSLLQDRIVSNQDRKAIQLLIKETMINIGADTNLISEMQSQNQIWVDYISSENRLYQKVENNQEFMTIMENFMDEYNENINFFSLNNKKQLNLIMFIDACLISSKIARCISLYDGHCLLIGISGKGRNTLARLGIFLAGYKVFEAGINQEYSMRQWIDDFKKVYTHTVIDKNQVGFLINDKKIVKESILEDLHRLLSTGQTLNIFNNKDIEENYNIFKTDCLKMGKIANRSDIQNYILNNIKNNFHLILTMSPDKKIFSTRFRNFPFLFKNCQLIYLKTWSIEAYQSVAKSLILDQVNELEIFDKSDQYISLCIEIHNQTYNFSENQHVQAHQRIFVEPLLFIQLLKIFNSIFLQKKKEVDSILQRLQKGNKYINQAKNHVQMMELELQQLMPSLFNTRKEINELLALISKDTQLTNEKQEQLLIEEKLAEQETKEAEKIKIQAEKAVSSVNKQLDEILQNISKLKIEHLVEIKSLYAPPIAVQTTITGVVILCENYIYSKGGEMILNSFDPLKLNSQREINYFDTAKKYLMNHPTDLLDTLMNYDKYSVSLDQLQRLKDLVVSRKEFAYKAVERTSYATKFLYLWVNAMIEFTMKQNESEPIRQNLSERKKNLEIKYAVLKEKNEELVQINLQLKLLQHQLHERQVQKNELELKLSENEVIIKRARVLTNSLQSETTKWEEESKIFMIQRSFLTINSLFCSACIVYLGPFRNEDRILLEKIWKSLIQQKQIEYHKDISMIQFLTTHIQIAQWNQFGLPNDDNSTKNCIISTRTQNVTIFIDPEQQAFNFLKKFYFSTLDILNENSKNMIKIIDYAIQYGKKILLKNDSNEFDNQLTPLIEKQIEKIGSQLSIKFGDKQLHYNTDFRLFITTVKDKPDYGPEIFVKLTIINFQISDMTLEEQLLGQIVSIENPDLERRKQDITVQIHRNKLTISEIEDNILKLVSDQEDLNMILHDEQLINQLQLSQQMYQDIQLRFESGKHAEKQINTSRDNYRRIARRGKLIFFTIMELQYIDPMYKYSLNWFKSLVFKTFDTIKHYKTFEEKIEGITNELSIIVFNNVQMSLYTDHKIIFPFLLAFKLDHLGNQIDNRLISFLCNNYNQFKNTEKLPPPLPFIPFDWWNEIYFNIQLIAQQKLIEGLDSDFLDNYKQEIETFFYFPEPYKCKVFDNSLNLTSFHKLLLIKILRLDKLQNSIQSYIQEKLGKYFTSPLDTDIQNLYQLSSNKIPILFLISPGSNPRSHFFRIVENNQMMKKYQILALGQGIAVQAEIKIKQAAKRGDWIMLENCHLAISWMMDLERIFDEIDFISHKDFRLWLTSASTSFITPGILQNSVKISVQPPIGLRSNLFQTYNNISELDFENSRQPNVYKKLFFCLSFFHSIVLDRRRYGSIGWNILYDFTYEDFFISNLQLKELLELDQEKANFIPFDCIYYLLGDIHYCGRVTDPNDRRLLLKLMQHYINYKTMQDGCSLSDSDYYYQPTVEIFNQYKQYIQNLPSITDPEVFGLHKNADLILGKDKGKLILMQLNTIYGTTNINQNVLNIDFEENQKNQIIDIRKQLPLYIDIEKSQGQFFISYLDSLNAVLLLEVQRYNVYLKIINDSLNELEQAIKGMDQMDQERQEIAYSLSIQKIPTHWSDYGFSYTEPLGGWLQEFNDRIDYFKEWVFNSRPNSFKLSAFFNPITFIIAQKQNYSRKQEISMNLVKFEFKVIDDKNLEEIIHQPAEGCYIYGIFLQGARWDYEKHYLSQPHSLELFSQLPVILLKPYIKELSKVLLYECPLYNSISRSGRLDSLGQSTNFVMYINLQCQKADDSDKWLVAGVAAFLGQKE